MFMKHDATSVDFGHFFQVKEEFIFVFSGFNDRFLTSVEVLEVSSGIWREFPDVCSHRTKFQAIQSRPDSVLLLGGKDVYGVQTAEVEEFCSRDMKNFPVYWKLPEGLAGFACCFVRENLLVLCGGSSGQEVRAKASLVNLENPERPVFSPLPDMLEPREEFALIAASDGRIYAFGGYNSEQ